MIDKEVKVYTEHGVGDHFNVTAWEESTTTNLPYSGGRPYTSRRILYA